MSKVFEALVEARGLGESFLHPKYEECLPSDCLPDVASALDRIRVAVKNQDRCLIYGDYDADGVTASTALYDTLTLAGLKNIEIMLPNRFTDGYGMSKKVVQKALDDRIKLVFTVDCGSRNNEIVEELAKHAVDTIITDHHECGNALPAAVAVINPKRRDIKVDAALKNLAGVGVVFKLAQAMVTAGMLPAGQEKWLLDLVTVGTICDSMLLTDENRRLCYYGMLVLEKTRRPGLKELMKRAGVKNLNGDAIGYQIGPRLNAAGRMDTAEVALNLLRSNQRTQAASLAEELELLNAQRKQQQNLAVKEINQRGLVEGSVIIEKGNWHEGVLGIIAGRLTEEHHKPSFVLSEIDGCLKGSGRSFGDFNLAAALDACGEYVIGGGGHAGACGVKVALDQFEGFRRAINAYYDSLGLQNQERFLAVQEDLTIKNLDDLSIELIEELKVLEPFGAGNQMPIFRLPAVRVMDAARLGTDGQHLRLTVWDQNEHNFKLMSFNAPEPYLDLRQGNTVDAWVTLEENIFRGIRSVEGRIVKLAW